MRRATNRELVVVGGGPAGMAAAIEARRHGVETLLLEERGSLGGQIYRQPRPDPDRPPSVQARAGQAFANRVLASGAEVRLNTVVWGAEGRELATLAEGGRTERIRAEVLVIATGAYDRPIAFPGWTLPGVMTAGGAHALVASQDVIPGRRILLAGSGPLLLSFAAQLHAHGANLVAVVEAAGSPSVTAAARFAATVTAAPSVVTAGARHLLYLKRKRVPLLRSHIVVEASGSGEVSQATIGRVDRDWRLIAGSESTLEVDTVLLGYGFVSSTELTRVIGCEHRFDDPAGGWIPVRDGYMRTSVLGVFAVGDGAGIGGALVAQAEGQLAGAAAAHDLGRGGAPRRSLSRLGRRVQRLERLRGAVAGLFPFGAGIYELADGDTIVCRCEEVTEAELRAAIASGSRDAGAVKSVTRAGMGYCQGRNCALQVEALLREKLGVAARQGGFRPRVPVKPVPLAAVAVAHEQEDPTARAWALSRSGRPREERRP